MAIIENGLDATLMRNKMESKDALANKGALYVGTGDVTPVTHKNKQGADETTNVPKTTFIAPNGGADDGKVLIADSTKTEGWKIDKIGPASIMPKSLTGAQLVDGAIGNSKLDITDQIKISPSYTTGPSSYPTFLSAYNAPLGSSKNVMLRLPRYSGTLITEDDVAKQYVKRDLITTECNGDYKLPDGTIVGLNGIDITLQFIGPEHMNGGDFAGVVTNVVKAENALSWEGSVKSWDSSGKIVLNLKDSTQMLTRLPWDIIVTYYQSAYSATNAEKTSFSNSVWQDGGSGSSIKEAAIEFGSSYQIRMTAISPDLHYNELTNIIYIQEPSTTQNSLGEINVGSSWYLLDKGDNTHDMCCSIGSVRIDYTNRTMKPQVKLYDLTNNQVDDFSAIQWWYRKIN